MAPRRDPDADLFEDEDDDEDLDAHEQQASNPHASSTRWRHEESRRYARHAAAATAHHHHHQHQHQQHDPIRSPGPAAAREPETRGDTGDLASFFNESRVSPAEAKGRDRDGDRGGGRGAASGGRGGAGSRTGRARYTPLMAAAGQEDEEGQGQRAAGEHRAAADGKQIAVGPLLNYRRTEGTKWVGSVLVVAKGGGKEQQEQQEQQQHFVPTLSLRRVGVEGDKEDGASAATTNGGTAGQTVHGLCLYSDARCTFWRFTLKVELEARPTVWEYSLPEMRFTSRTKPQLNRFHLAALSESMRIMFHSCNGFSVGTDEQAFSGPALWHDVLRKHADAPFHVMIGGGDQIYNDGIRVDGPLRPWTDMSNPKKRRDFLFPEQLRQDCDDYYLRNYLGWYGTEPFATANGQIPQLNIWDDHDIIDGFGSYVDDFMKCAVFRGIGGTAHKYYMLFQHHMPPPPATFTTDADAAQPGKVAESQGVDPVQRAHAYVHPPLTESNYIVGPKPGPWVAEHSHSMYARLGSRLAFFGIDARTERTRHQVNYPETYEMIFSRLRQELSQAQGQIKHLIVLLGIPIAYPRLAWLENIFASPLLGPIKFLNRRFGLGGGFFNKFDGSVDLLDDLDDHYTARTHKQERKALMRQLQALSAEFSVRVTILGGDVHLAALGRFYSSPGLGIPTDNDYRYMVNVVSSAITNKPPPQAIANLLARRNKIHHLDKQTDETLLSLFRRDPGETTKTAGFNHVTMPSRNYAIITENSPSNPEPRSPEAAASLTYTTTADGQLAPPSHHHPSPLGPRHGDVGHGSGTGNGNGSLLPPGSSAGASTHSKLSMRSTASGKSGHAPLGAGEVGAGTKHKAASAQHGKGNDGSLDVVIQVEIDQHDHQGHTQGYGLTIPALHYEGPPPVPPLPMDQERGGHAHRLPVRSAPPTRD